MGDLFPMLKPAARAPNLVSIKGGVATIRRLGSSIGTATLHATSTSLIMAGPGSMQTRTSTPTVPTRLVVRRNADQQSR